MLRNAAFESRNEMIHADNEQFFLGTSCVEFLFLCEIPLIQNPTHVSFPPLSLTYMTHFSSAYIAKKKKKDESLPTLLHILIMKSLMCRLRNKWEFSCVAFFMEPWLKKTNKKNPNFFHHLEQSQNCDFNHQTNGS